ncbi:MAG: hypothetical protein ACREV5_13485 [Steroidobacter sp.]
MSASSDDTPPTASGARERLRFELILASIWLGVGLFLLPAIIYIVGVPVLGAYGENQGLGAFYMDYFRDLAEPSGRTWAIALGPLLIVLLVRAVFLGVRPAASDAGDAAHNAPPRKPADQARVEPRVSSD